MKLIVNGKPYTTNASKLLDLKEELQIPSDVTILNGFQVSENLDIKEKYEGSDWIKTPLVIFLNNTYDLLKKKKIMKEYGFEEIEKEVKKMCNFNQMIARENIEKGLVQGQKRKILN